MRNLANWVFANAGRAMAVLVAANMQLGQQLQGKQLQGKQLPIEVTINVNGAQDSTAIARQVRAELDKILNQQAR